MSTFSGFSNYTVLNKILLLELFILYTDNIFTRVILRVKFVSADIIYEMRFLCILGI